MSSIYSRVEEVVKSKGKKLEMDIAGPLFGKKSLWQVGNLLVSIHENPPTEASRIVLVMERGENPKILYLSPFAVRAGALDFFGIEDKEVSSEKRLSELLTRFL